MEDKQHLEKFTLSLFDFTQMNKFLISKKAVFFIYSKSNNDYDIYCYRTPLYNMIYAYKQKENSTKPIMYNYDQVFFNYTVEEPNNIL